MPIRSTIPGPSEHDFCTRHRCRARGDQHRPAFGTRLRQGAGGADPRRLAGAARRYVEDLAPSHQRRSSGPRPRDPAFQRRTATPAMTWPSSRSPAGARFLAAVHRVPWRWLGEHAPRRSRRIRAACFRKWQARSLPGRGARRSRRRANASATASGIAHRRGRADTRESEAIRALIVRSNGEDRSADRFFRSGGCRSRRA